MNTAEKIESLRNEIEIKKQKLNELIQEEENDQNSQPLTDEETGEAEDIVNNFNI